MFKKDFLPFKEARSFVRNLKIKNWNKYIQSGKAPMNIPIHPERTYKKEWISLYDWLGESGHNRNFRPFKEAQKFVRGLKLKNSKDWLEFCKSGKKPSDIPSFPSRIYKKKWINMFDWLGKGLNTYFRPFEEAQNFVRRLKFESTTEWFEFCKSGKKPSDIPTRPSVYKKWISWYDWLGKEKKIYPTFEEAKKMVKEKQILSISQYHKHCTKLGLPFYIEKEYKTEWKNCVDFFGALKNFPTFEDLKKIVQNAKITSKEQYTEVYKSLSSQFQLPAHPNKIYKNEWKGNADFFGKSNNMIMIAIKQNLKQLGFSEGFINRNFVANLQLT